MKLSLEKLLATATIGIGRLYSLVQQHLFAWDAWIHAPCRVQKAMHHMISVRPSVDNTECHRADNIHTISTLMGTCVDRNLGKKKAGAISCNLLSDNQEINS